MARLRVQTDVAATVESTDRWIGESEDVARASLTSHEGGRKVYIWFLAL